VLLSVPSDVFDLPATGFVPGRPPIHPEQHVEPDPTLVRKVLHLLTDARRPVILAGAGVLRARSTDALVRFAQTIQVPVISAWRRADVFPNDNPLYLGMTGLGAPDTVKRRLLEADAFLVLGSRLGEMTTFGYELPATTTRWAQVDIEPVFAGTVRPDVVMSSDVAAFLRVAQRVLARAALEAASFDARKAANAVDRAAYEAATVVGDATWEGEGVHPGNAVETLARMLPAEAIVTTDAGDFGTWAARGLQFRRPGTFLGSCAGPMGYGLPAAIGATLARPGRLGVALAGDGGFAMSMADLETAVRERAHVVAVVFDNARYGTIYRHQQQRGLAGVATRLGRVDFAAIAEACGAAGFTVRSDAELEAAIGQALEAGRPAVVHLHVSPAWTVAGAPPVEAQLPLPVVEAAAFVEGEAEIEVEETLEVVETVEIVERNGTEEALRVELVETVEVEAAAIETVEVIPVEAATEPAPDDDATAPPEVEA